MPSRESASIKTPLEKVECNDLHTELLKNVKKYCKSEKTALLVMFYNDTVSAESDDYKIFSELKSLVENSLRGL